MKNKKILIPLIAVAVLAVLLVVVLLTVGEKDTATDNPETNVTSDSDLGQESAQEHYIFDIDSSSVNYIRVRTSGETFAFKKSDDVWVMDGNSEVSVSSASVSSLATSVISVTYYELIDDGTIKAEDCGITSESDCLTFNCDQGEITIFRGINTPDNLQTYVMTSADDVVYLANTKKIDALFNPLNEYRHSASLNLDFDNITDITLKTDKTIVLKKGEVSATDLVYNEWRMTSPVEVAVRDDQVKPLIIEPLKKIRITDYISDAGDFEKYGLGAKDRYISLKDATGKSQTLYFSEQKDGQYYISVDNKNSIYSISYDAAPYVEIDTGDLFDRNIHLVKMSQISTVTLKGDGYDYEIEFSAEDGKINGTTVSADVMNYQVFPAICGIMADDILTEAKGETKVKLTFTYTDSTKDVITFADYDERHYSVSKNGVVKYLILKAKISDVAAVLEECK